MRRPNQTFELAPGTSVSFRILTGASHADAEIKTLIARYLSAEASGRFESSTQLRAWAQALKDAVNQHGWDGRWYLYAITDG